MTTSGILSPGTFLGLTLLASAVVPRASAEPPAAPSKPNLVWIWADNLAWGDLACYGSKRHATPNLDRLAAGGVRFTRYYVAHVVCSPSRAALLTGRQPHRNGVVDVLYPDSPVGLPADEITLAEALRQCGYATGAVGKWHLGDRREHLPRQHGFDRYFGMPLSIDMLPALLCRDDDIVEQVPGEKVADISIRYTDEARRFVAEHRGRPFFLYLAHTLPHPPLILPPGARHAGASLYADAVAHLDQQVGRLVDRLHELGLARRTLVMFSSDNGPLAKGADTGPLRGGITEASEGGLRVPLIASWPGTLPAGRVVDTPAIAYDVFPTFVRLADGALHADREYDGQDIWPLLTGQGEFHRARPFCWVNQLNYENRTDNVSAVLDPAGRWKLLRAVRSAPLREPELYDVAADPGEKRNLARQHPDVVARLKAEAERVQATIPRAWRGTYTVRDPAKANSGLRPHE
jgi:arylsulfatase A-like enzyme